MKWSMAWLLAAICVSLLPATAGAASGDAKWTRIVQTYDDSSGSDVATHADGVYMAGDGDTKRCPVVDEGNPVCDRVAFLRRYTEGGAIVWSRSFNLAPPAPQPSDDWLRQTRAESIAVDSSGVYVTGTVRLFQYFGCPGVDEVFVRKYTLAGTQVWTRRFGTGIAVSEQCGPISASISGNAIAVDATGVYVGGTTEGSFAGYQRAGESDIFLRKYTADGALVWTRQAGTSASDSVADIALDSAGVFIAGETNGAWLGQASKGSIDAFVRKYSRSGSAYWTRQFGSVGPDSARSIAAEGSIFYVGGDTSGTFPRQTSKGEYDAWVRKYVRDGTLVWTRQFGTSESDFVSGLDADASGVFLTGETSGTFPGQTRRGNADAFVTSFSSTGSRNWTRQFGSSYIVNGRDWGKGIAIGPPPRDTQQDSRQGLYVTGAWSTDDSRYHRAFLRKHEK